MRCVGLLALLLLATGYVTCQSSLNPQTNKDYGCSSASSSKTRPEPRTWADSNNRKRDPLKDFRFLEWLIGGHDIDDKSANNCPPRNHSEYEGYDGWYNNFAQPSLGAVDTPLLRVLPPAYSDGVYQPVKRDADPFLVSDDLMARSTPTGQDDEALSIAGRTAFQLYFGQQVVEEILDAQGSGCPPEYFNLKIPENHTYFHSAPKVPEMPLLRTRHDFTTGYSPNNPRQQLNEITPYLDGGLIYGTSKAWADNLRIFTADVTTPDGKTFRDGKLAPDGLLAWHHQLGELFPAENLHGLPMANPPPPAYHQQYTKRGYTDSVTRFFKLGNPRGNENPFLLTFGILGFRWHNHIARYIKLKNPSWTGEHIFNEARKWVIATQQALIMYDWLPKYIRDQPNVYNGYIPTTNPQIAHIFQSAAMRFGHTMVTQGVHLKNRSADGCDSNGFARTCNSFWRSHEWFKNDTANFERFLMGLSSQSTEKEDSKIVEDLRGSLFGPLEFSRRDLMAINIQRARDHGLPDYNTARRHYGLEPLISLDPAHFKKITNAPDVVPLTEVLEKLKNLYNDNPDMVDVWAGGLLETNKGPGQLFKRVIKDQFERIRDGDRFWFENNKSNMFSAEERQRLKQVKIIDLVLSVTNLIVNEDIQADPFLAVNKKDNELGKKCLSKMTLKKENCSVFKDGSEDIQTCYYLPLPKVIENCTKPETYDHFEGSQTAYILTLFSVLVACFGLVFMMLMVVYCRSNKKTKIVYDSITVRDGMYKAKERVSHGSNRYVLVKFVEEEKTIEVYNLRSDMLRFICLENINNINIKHTEDWTHIVISVVNHYDLFLSFPETSYGEKFHQEAELFFNKLGKEIKLQLESRVGIRRNITTVYDRKKMIAKLSHFVISKAWGDESEASETEKFINSVSESDKDYLKTKITQHELAEQLGIKSNCAFLQQLFKYMDLDKNGFISIKEFWDVMVVFAKGTPEEKAQLFFNIYDLDGNKKISAQDMEIIVKSSLGNESKNQDSNKLVENMLNAIGVSKDHQLDFQQFKQIFMGNSHVFHQIQIEQCNRYSVQNVAHRTFSLNVHCPTHRTTSETLFRERAEIEKESQNYELKKTQEGEISKHCRSLSNMISQNQNYCVLVALYTIIMWLIFLERAYYYTVEREHGGLRRIAGLGVTITRGAASAMMFTFSTLLITMCRNTMLLLRSSFLHKFIPFDGMVDMHKYIGAWALFWSMCHIIGHAINFYHISTQTPTDLLCLFRDFFRGSDILPKFQYWAWQTTTGVTGVLLTLQIAVIYSFAYFGRKYFFQLFWITHNSYPLFYFLMVLHGSGNLVQRPFFLPFFVGPCFLFILDKLVSTSRNKVKIDVMEAEHLPSDVTKLTIRRPLNFNYESGQWVKIASLGISTEEYHPFTLSSAPNEEHLTLHIRSVGPWTKKVRNEYPPHQDIKDQDGFKYPTIYMDGPFGEGHQTWLNYEVAVLVGSGIGVTPFTSILKDLIYKLKQPQTKLKTKKVYFLWVTRSQSQFEWVIDILRQVEQEDDKGVIRNHIFITQFKSKYDFRTIMLYLAERHFQKISGESLFTGLHGLTHFSRPDFHAVLTSIKNKYPKLPVIGVFTCGNPGLSFSVEMGCQTLNKEKGPIFKHYYENF